MARKKFNLKPGAHWSIGMGVAGARPALLLMIGECATIWPFVEHQMALALGVLIGSDTDAAMAMFSSIRQGRAQRDAISAAASVVLNADDRDLLLACLSALKTAEAARDDLVHGNWGISDEVPDGLLWIEAKHHAPWNAAAIIKSSGEAPPHEELGKHFYVYTRADLQEVRELLHLAWRVSFDLVQYLRLDPRAEAQRVPLRDQLLAVPLVRQALDHLTRAKNNP